MRRAKSREEDAQHKRTPLERVPVTVPVNALQRTAALLGREVVSPGGAPVGAIAELIIDCGSGRISHLVVRVDHRVLYLPWAAIDIAFDERHGVILTLTPERGRCDSPPQPL